MKKIDKINQAIETLEEYWMDKFIDDENNTIIIIWISKTEFEKSYRFLCNRIANSKDWEYDWFYYTLNKIISKKWWSLLIF